MVLAGIVYAMVTAILSVLAHRSHMRTRRHDLLVNIKSRRLEYERMLADRQKSLQADYANSDVELVMDASDIAGAIGPETSDNASPQRSAA